jgi:hypothetical protein
VDRVAEPPAQRQTLSRPPSVQLREGIIVELTEQMG